MNEKWIGISGSHGEVEFNGKGERLPDQEDYPEIVRINVEEWLQRYPHETPYNMTHDILDWGTWMKSGEYEEPCESWRLERESERKDDKLYAIVED